METEADIGEIIPLKEKCLNPGELYQPPQTVVYQVKSGKVEVASNVDVEIVNSSLEGNAGVTAGESFCESPSISKVPDQGTNTNEETPSCQVEEIKPEEKKMEKEASLKSTEVTETKEHEVVDDINEKKAVGDTCHQISYATEISSSKIGKIEQLYVKVVKEDTSKEQIIANQVEADKQGSVEENQINIGKQTTTPLKEGRIKANDAEPKASHGATTVEASTGLNEEPSVLSSDLTLHNMDTNVETCKQASLKDEHEDNAGYAETITIEDKNTERISGVVQGEETDGCSSVLNEQNSPNVSKLTEKEEVEEDVTNDSTGEAFLISATSPGIQSNNQENSSFLEDAKDKLDSPSVTLATDTSSVQEEASNVTGTEESQYVTNLNDKKEDIISTADQSQEKNHVKISSDTQTEELSLQEVDKTEISRTVIETSSENYVKEGPQERMIEAIGIKNEADSLVKHEDGKKNIDAEMTLDASALDNRDGDRDAEVTEEENVSQAVTAPQSIQEESVKEKNLSSKEPYQKIETEETEFVVKSFGETHLLEQETILIESKVMGHGSNMEPQGQLHEASGDRYDEKHNENDSQACESTTKTEGRVVTTEQSSETSENEIEKLEKLHDKGSEDRSERTDGETGIKEDKHEEEASEMEKHKSKITGDDNTKCHTDELGLETINGTDFLRVRTEKNFQAGSLHETTTGLKDEEVEKTSTKNDKTTGIEEFNDEEVTHANGTNLSSELINKETVESYQQSDKEADVSKGEDTKNQITEGTRNENMSPEAVEEDPVKKLENDEKNIDNPSSREMFMGPKTTGTVDSIRNEEKESNETPDLTLQCLQVKEEEILQTENLITSEGSSAEISMMNDGENHTNLPHAETEDHKETMNGIKYLEQTMQKDEEKEHTEQPLSVLSEEAETSLSQSDTNTVQESVEHPQEDESEAETKKQQSITNGSYIGSVLPEAVHEGLVIFQKSSTENTQEFAAATTCENIASETTQNAECPVETIPTSLVDTTASDECFKLITCAKDDKTTENQEENFDKKDLQEASIGVDDTRNEIPKEKQNLSSRELYDIEITEGETLDNKVNEINATHPLEKELGEVVNSETQEKFHEAKAGDEVKTDETGSQACKGTKITDSEPSKEAENTETSEAETEKPAKVHEPESKEEKEIKNALSIEENVGNEEESGKDIQNMETSADPEKYHVEEAFNYEEIEQNFQVEETSTTSEGEENSRQEISGIDKEIPGVDEVTHNDNMEEFCTHLSLEVTEKEAAESSEQVQKETDKTIEENTEEKVILQTTSEEEPIRNFQSFEKDSDKSSSGQNFEKYETAETVTSTQAQQTNMNPEASQTSMGEGQGSLRSENHKVCDGSPAEEIVVDGSSIKEAEDKEKRNELTEGGEHNKELLEEEEEEEDEEQTQLKDGFEQPPHLISGQPHAEALSQIDSVMVKETAQSPHENEERDAGREKEDILLKGEEDPEEILHDDNIGQETKTETLSQTDNSVVEETIENPQKNEESYAGSKKEDGTNESVTKSHQLKSVAQKSVKDLENYDRVEKSNTEILKESEAAERAESIMHEKNQRDETPTAAIPSSLVKEAKSIQFEDRRIPEKSPLVQFEDFKNANAAEKLDRVIPEQHEAVESVGNITHETDQNDSFNVVTPVTQAEDEESLHYEDKDIAVGDSAEERMEEPSSVNTGDDNDRITLIEKNNKEGGHETSQTGDYSPHETTQNEESLNSSTQASVVRGKEAPGSDKLTLAQTSAKEDEDQEKYTGLIETEEHNKELLKEEEEEEEEEDAGEISQKVAQCPVKNFKNDGCGAENSNKKILEQPKVEESVENIKAETNQNDSPNATNAGAQAEHVKSLQCDNKNIEIKASAVEEPSSINTSEDSNHIITMIEENTKESDHKKSKTNDYSSHEVTYNEESHNSSIEALLVREAAAPESDDSTPVESSNRNDEDKENYPGLIEVKEHKELSEKENTEKILQKDTLKEHIEEPSNIKSTETEAQASREFKKTVESPHDNAKRDAGEKEAAIEESNIGSIPLESVAQIPVENFENDHDKEDVDQCLQDNHKATEIPEEQYIPREHIIDECHMKNMSKEPVNQGTTKDIHDDEDNDEISNKEMHEIIQATDHDGNTGEQIMQDGKEIEDILDVSAGGIHAESPPEKDKEDENDIIKSKQELDHEKYPIDEQEICKTETSNEEKSSYVGDEALKCTESNNIDNAKRDAGGEKEEAIEESTIGSIPLVSVAQIPVKNFENDDHKEGIDQSLQDNHKTTEIPEQDVPKEHTIDECHMKNISKEPVNQGTAKDLHDDEANDEISNKEILEEFAKEKMGESIALETNQNYEVTNKTIPTTPVKEAESLQDESENVNLEEPLLEAETQDDGSLAKASQDKGGSAGLVEGLKQSEAEISHGNENVEPKSQNEPQEFLELSEDGITQECEVAILDNKVDEEVQTVQKNEKTGEEETKQNVDSDGSRLTVVSFSEMLSESQVTAETYYANEVVEEKLVTCETDPEATKAYASDYSEKLDSEHKSESKEEEINEENVIQFQGHDTACMNDDAEKHITMEERLSRDISPQLAGEEINIIPENKEDIAQIEKHKEIETKNTVEDTGKQVLDEINIAKDQFTETAIVIADDKTVMTPKAEMHEIIQATDQDGKPGEQVMQYGKEIEDILDVSAGEIHAENPPEKDKEDENDVVKSKQELDDEKYQIDEQEICKSETSNDEQSSYVGDEALKCTESKNIDKKGILDEEIKESVADTPEASLKESDAAENFTNEHEAGSINQVHETTETKSSGVELEENLVSADPNTKLDHTSEIVPSDHSSQAIPESSLDKFEENQISESVEQRLQGSPGSWQEIGEKTEPNLKIEDQITETRGIEDIKVTALNKEVRKEFVQAEGYETVEHINKDGDDIKELQSESIGNEIIHEVKETEQSSEYLTTKESNEQTKIGSLDVREARDLERESSATKENEETKEVIKEQITENRDSPSHKIKQEITLKETSKPILEEVQRDEKPVPVSAILSDASIQHAAETNAGQQEIVELEENNSNLSSQLQTDDQISESVEERSQGSPGSWQDIGEKTEPNLKIEDQINETRDIEDIKLTALNEEVHKEFEQAEGDETVEHFNKDGDDIKELHSESIRNEIIHEVKETKLSSEYLTTKDTNERTEIGSLDVQEARDLEKESSATKEKEETKEVIKEQISENTDSPSHRIKEEIILQETSVPRLEKVQRDEKPVLVPAILSDASIQYGAETNAGQQESVELEENNSNLASQLPTDDQISEFVEQRLQGSPGSCQEMGEKTEPNLKIEDQINETRDIEDINVTALNEELHEEFEQAEGDETVEHFNKDGDDIKELHSESIGTEIIHEVKETELSAEYLTTKDSNERTEIGSMDVREARDLEKESSATKENEETEEVIKEQITENTDSPHRIKEEITLEEESEPRLEEVQRDEKPVLVSAILSDAGIQHATETNAGQQESAELEENNSNLASQLPTDDQISKSVEQRLQESPGSWQEIGEKTKPNLKIEDQINETRDIKDIKVTALNEEVHQEFDQAEGDETVEHFNKDGDDIKELHSESIGNEIIHEVKETELSSEYLTKDSNERTEIESFDVREAWDLEKESSTTKENKETEEVIKEQITENKDSPSHKIKEEITPEETSEHRLEKVQRDEKPILVSAILSDASIQHASETNTGQQESMELEENNSNLASQLPTYDQEIVMPENMALADAAVGDIEKSREASDTYETKNHHIRELHKGEIAGVKEVVETVLKSQEKETVAKNNYGINQNTPEEEITKEPEVPSLALPWTEEDCWTETTTKNIEEHREKAEMKKDKLTENFSAIQTVEDRSLQIENPQMLEISQLYIEEKKGTPYSPTEKHEEKGGTVSDTKEESEEASGIVSQYTCHSLRDTAKNEVAVDQTPHSKKSEEQYPTKPCALLSRELELGSSTEIKRLEEVIKGEEWLEDQQINSEETYLQNEESSELKVSEPNLEPKTDTESSNETQKEVSVTSVEIGNKKEDFESELDFYSEENEAAKEEQEKEEEIIPVHINCTDNSQEQNLMSSYSLLSKEQEGEDSTVPRSTEEKTKEIKEPEVEPKAIRDAWLQKGEPRELKVHFYELQPHIDEQESLKEIEIEEKEDGATNNLKEETEGVSELVTQSSSQNYAAVSEVKITSLQPQPTEKSKEENQKYLAGLQYEKGELEISTTAETVEGKTTREEMPENAPKTIEEAYLQKEDPREFKPSEPDLQVDDHIKNKSEKEAPGAKIGTAEESSKLQSQHEIEKRDAEKVDLVALVNQGGKTSGATELVRTEVTNEQIMEEKSNCKSSHAVLGEDATKQSHQEHQPVIEETLGAMILEKEIENEKLPEEIAKADQSETIKKQISAEKGPLGPLIQNETEKEHSLGETGEKIDDAERELSNRYDKATTVDSSVDSVEKESSVQISQKEVGTEVDTEIIQTIHQLEKTSDRALKHQISRIKEPETMSSTGEKEVLEAQQKPNVETSKITEVRDANTSAAESEVESIVPGVEHSMDDENGKAIKETVSKDSAALSLQIMQQRPRREQQSAKEPTTNKERTEKAKSDEEVEEDDDGEEEEEGKKNDSGSDAPVMVESARDVEIKIVHKKSHHILSGVGSKVKQSIIKVKKAITGKSSQSKQHSPK